MITMKKLQEQIKNIENKITDEETVQIIARITLTEFDDIITLEILSVRSCFSNPYGMSSIISAFPESTFLKASALPSATDWNMKYPDDTVLRISSSEAVL